MTVLDRRSFLAAAGIGTIGAVTALGTSITFADDGDDDGDVVVVLFLKGGMDGLSFTPPVKDEGYYRNRPRIAVPRPGEANGALRLDSATTNVRFGAGFDGYFGLHPAARRLHDGLWAQGRLAFIPAAGLPGSSFSHFLAQRRHFRGSVSNAYGGGWLGRLTNVRSGDGLTPAVYSTNDNRLVAGSPSAMGVVGAMDRVRLNGFADRRAAATAMARIYSGTDSVSSQGRLALDVADRIGALEGGRRDGYGNDGYGRAFSELGSLLAASPSLGIRSAAIMVGGWDHHSNLGAPGDTDGRFHRNTEAMSNAIATFAAETDNLQGITLVVMSEFGRTTNQNGNGGTDHGQGTTMMVAGGNIRGGVYGDDFPDTVLLPAGQRRGAVPVLTDYRKITGEVIRSRANVTDLGMVFPGFQPSGSALGLSG